jgi:hypothetical protein
MNGPLPRDFHLSDEALTFFLANPVGTTSGVGGHERRREGHRARLEATIEIERAAGRLFTPEDVEAWMQRVVHVLRHIPARGETWKLKAEDASFLAECHQRRNGTK